MLLLRRAVVRLQIAQAVLNTRPKMFEHRSHSVDPFTVAMPFIEHSPTSLRVECNSRRNRYLCVGLLLLPYSQDSFCRSRYLSAHEHLCGRTILAQPLNSGAAISVRCPRDPRGACACKPLSTIASTTNAPVNTQQFRLINPICSINMRQKY
jgi:hypothetical protein